MLCRPTDFVFWNILCGRFLTTHRSLLYSTSFMVSGGPDPPLWEAGAEKPWETYLPRCSIGGFASPRNRGISRSHTLWNLVNFRTKSCLCFSNTNQPISTSVGVRCLRARISQLPIVKPCSTPVRSLYPILTLAGWPGLGLLDLRWFGCWFGHLGGWRRWRWNRRRGDARVEGRGCLAVARLSGMEYGVYSKGAQKRLVIQNFKYL